MEVTIRTRRFGTFVFYCSGTGTDETSQAYVRRPDDPPFSIGKPVRDETGKPILASASSLANVGHKYIRLIGFKEDMNGRNNHSRPARCGSRSMGRSVGRGSRELRKLFR